MDVDDARRCFDALPFEMCFFGHSHYPGAFVLEGERITRRPAVGDEAILELVEGHRYLINPGSVGQPRDRNTKCGFAVYDDRNVATAPFSDAGGFPLMQAQRSRAPQALVRDLTLRVRLKGADVPPDAGTVEVGLAPTRRRFFRVLRPVGVQRSARLRRLRGRPAWRRIARCGGRVRGVFPDAEAS